MSASPARAIAVGGICLTRIYQVEHVAPVPAKVLAHALVEVVDGMALSAAFAFMRLGGQAAIWGRCGDDAGGRAARQSLRQEGLDVSSLRNVAGAASSQAAVIVDAKGERLVVPFHDPTLDASPHWLPLQQLAGADILLCDVRWPEGAQAAMRAARQLGVPVMLDGEAAAPQTLETLVQLASHAVFSDAGVLALTGAGSVDVALFEVAGRHASHVGATCGADGYAWVEGGVVRRVSAPKVKVVDTLGAGDVFHGAFALALTEGQSPERAASFACHAASLKCTRLGGRLGCPSRQEVLASLRAGP